MGGTTNLCQYKHSKIQSTCYNTVFAFSLQRKSKFYCLFVLFFLAMRLYNINVIFTFDNSYCQKISQKDVFDAALFCESYWSTLPGAFRNYYQNKKLMFIVHNICG